jgi:UDP-N-acetylmuramyl pentapeptide phosphotransferase/UDP-N-acetylglucosamine-1-phosphate transferase
MNSSAALVLVALAAAAISASLIVLLRPLLQRYALARPNARSSHGIPTPQGAGIAVIAATLGVVGISAGIMDLDVQAMLFVATIFIALVGLADDIRPMPIVPRLLLQAMAVGAVILAAPAELQIVPALPLPIERGMLLLAGLWFVNLVNFMDGLDLMTVAEVVPVAGTLAVLGWLGDFPLLPTMIAAALGGALLGFAPFNRPVAKVFLGDVGSLPIGLVLGWGLLQLTYQHQIIAALLLPLYYLADATLTLVLRISRGEPFWVAHRSHFYQRAIQNGFTVSHVVGEVFVLNLVLAGLAIASVHANSIGWRVALLAIGAMVVALILYRFSVKKTRLS